MTPDAATAESNSLKEKFELRVDQPCFGFFNWPTKIVHLFHKLCLKESTRMRPNCRNMRKVFQIYHKFFKKENNNSKSSVKGEFEIVAN